ncbi:AAA family ATPase [Spiractinospora alimapuensis]|nr:AAA family ATPase [Spiractinospora alimapuensis]
MARGRRIVVSGGPGSGKTTLLEALAGAGARVMPEAGRAIIRQQRAVDGPALPWRDVERFAEAMLHWELRSHEEAASAPGDVVFDRGVPDVVGYLRLEGRWVPAHVDAAARRMRYHPVVFLAPPWREIYRADAERHQSFAVAERTFEAMARAYPDYGYEVVELPRVGVAERVGFVAQTLGGLRISASPDAR